MEHHLLLLPLLTFAALADWLIARTLTRLLIFMPKTLGLIAFYQGLIFVGQFATTLASLLCLATLVWMSRQSWRAREDLWFVPAWALVAVIGLIAIFTPLSPVLLGAYHLLVLVIVALVGWRAISAGETWAQKAAHAIPALVLLAGGLHQGIQVLYQAWSLDFLPCLSEVLFNLGELLLIAALPFIWWVYGRGASRWVWLSSAALPIGFVVFHTLNPALTGIMAIWSIGLTLYLPWVLYALGIWLGSVTVFILFRQNSPLAWALLLLAASGYTPQTNTQVLYGLIALWMIAQSGATCARQIQFLLPSYHATPFELNS